jgi:PleD family two-component response regulator
MDDLFNAVDVSMYEAKNAGRNLVRLHEPHATIATQVL